MLPVVSVFYNIKLNIFLVLDCCQTKPDIQTGQFVIFGSGDKELFLYILTKTKMLVWKTPPTKHEGRNKPEVNE